MTFASGALCKLAHLDVVGCSGFGRQGAAYLCHLTSLTHVNLADTALQTTGAQAGQAAHVTQALAQLSQLQHINLNHVQLMRADRLAICQAAKGVQHAGAQGSELLRVLRGMHLWPALTSLVWQSDDHDHDEVALALLALLPGLRHLDLSGTMQPFPRPPQHAVALQLPAAQTHLTYLDLCGRRIGQSQLLTVVQAHAALCQFNVSIEDLSLPSLQALQDSAAQQLYMSVADQRTAAKLHFNPEAAVQQLNIRDVQRECPRAIARKISLLRIRRVARVQSEGSSDGSDSDHGSDGGNGGGAPGNAPGEATDSGTEDSNSHMDASSDGPANGFEGSAGHECADASGAAHGQQQDVEYQHAQSAQPARLLALSSKLGAKPKRARRLFNSHSRRAGLHIGNRPGNSHRNAVNQDESSAPRINVAQGGDDHGGSDDSGNSSHHGAGSAANSGPSDRDSISSPGMSRGGSTSILAVHALPADGTALQAAQAANQSASHVAGAVPIQSAMPSAFLLGVHCAYEAALAR